MTRLRHPARLLPRLLLVAALASVLTVPAGAATTKKKVVTKKTTAKKPATPVAGQSCTPLGAHAAGTSLDCVAVGSKLQWQPKGTKLNPYRIGETFSWTQSSNFRNAGALISERRISVVDYLPDASTWVSQWADNQPQDIFDAAEGLPVRGVRVRYTLVSATDASSRNLGSLTTFWLGDDKDAGCCEQGTLQWGTPPDESIDAYTRLDDGATRTGVALFARSDAQLGARPLMRLAWNDVNTNKILSVFFDVLPVKG